MGNIEYGIKKKSRLRKGIKIFLLSLLSVVFILWVLPAPKAMDHPYLNHDKPLIIAHQGGANLAPSSTMPAFENAVRLGVDVLEFDIHITKDGHLVAIHDPTVDRTTEGSGKVEDMTLTEIKELDAGYNFKDLDGNYSFRGKGVKIVTVEEIFEAFPDYKMMIEIKDDNPPERMDEVISKLWELIDLYGMADKMVVTSFDQGIVDAFQKLSGNEVALGGGRSEVKQFVITSMISFQSLYNPYVHAFQLPLREGKIDLSKPYVIDNAHKRGMEVYYWTINDPETMEMLIQRGADGIITDRPDIMLEVLSKQ